MMREVQANKPTLRLYQTRVGKHGERPWMLGRLQSLVWESSDGLVDDCMATISPSLALFTNYHDGILRHSGLG